MLWSHWVFSIDTQRLEHLPQIGATEAQQLDSSSTVARQQLDSSSTSLHAFLLPLLKARGGMEVLQYMYSYCRSSVHAWHALLLASICLDCLRVVTSEHHTSEATEALGVAVLGWARLYEQLRIAWFLQSHFFAVMPHQEAELQVDDTMHTVPSSTLLEPLPGISVQNLDSGVCACVHVCCIGTDTN
jgi:hypothetical protein